MSDDAMRNAAGIPLLTAAGFAPDFRSLCQPITVFRQLVHYLTNVYVRSRHDVRFCYTPRLVLGIRIPLHVRGHHQAWS